MVRSLREEAVVVKKSSREGHSLTYICCNLVIQKLLLLLFTSANGYTRMYSFSFFSSLFSSLSLSKKTQTGAFESEQPDLYKPNRRWLIKNIVAFA